MSLFSVKLMKIDRIIFDGKATAVSIPSSKGYLTLLKNHIPIVGSLSKGHIKVTTNDHADDALNDYHVESGFFDMSANGCTIYIDS